MSTVLVTGGSGFIGSHCIAKLLALGHHVRTTVRSSKREADVRALFKDAAVDTENRLTFAVANLENDEGWTEAAKDCDYVLHVASPFPANLPRDENELIRPARDGALRVLRACRDAGVKRVVLTSSVVSVAYGLPPQDAPFTENNWTNTEAEDIMPYVKSKTLAEKAAWQFIAQEGGSLELAVVNPVAVFGPVFGPDYSTSILIVQKMLDGKLPGCPKMKVGVVDVRDVVDLHIRAMTHSAAKSERFLAVTGDFMSLQEIALVLQKNLGTAARRVVSREIPNWVVYLGSFIDPAVKQILPDLGLNRNATNEKARRLLDWNPISREDAILATAESLIRLGLVKI